MASLARRRILLTSKIAVLVGPRLFPHGLKHFRILELAEILRPVGRGLERIREMRDRQVHLADRRVDGFERLPALKARPKNGDVLMVLDGQDLVYEGAGPDLPARVF